MNSKLVINMGVRYDWFSAVQFEGTDPENPAGIVNLDGEPDANFTFGPVRSAGSDLRGRREAQSRAARRLRLQPGRRRAHRHQRRLGDDVPAPRYAELRDVDRDDFGHSRNPNFSAVEAANLGLRYPIYNEDMLIRYQWIYTPSPLSPVGLLIDPNIQAPYAQVFTGGIQHAFGKATVVDAAYVGTRGYNFRMAQNLQRAGSR